MYAKKKKMGESEGSQMGCRMWPKNLNVLQMFKTISLKRVDEKGANQSNFGNGVCKSKAEGTVHKHYTPVYQVAAHRSAG